jgi:hypothetical protein
VTAQTDTATGAKDERGASPPRPIAATFIALLACGSGVSVAVTGVKLVLDAGGDEEDIAAGSSMLVLASFYFVIAVGALRVKRWAWVLFMTWAALMLAVNLLRRYFFDAEPSYLVLALSTLTVFLLTPLDVQVAFGVRAAPSAPLDSHDRVDVG